MSNTVITNYTDLNGPSTKTDSSVVVIVNKDGSLSVDQKLLGTLMGTDGSQGAISVVRVGHEGKPDDATDSDTDDEKVHHVTLSVDSYYNEPDSIIKYDSGAEMLQSLRIETRENSLIGFQNDHCYTPLTSPSQQTPKKNENVSSYEESVIEITQSTPPPPPPPPTKTLPTSKKITILEQQIIPKGKKILINSTESPVILKDVLHKPLPVISKLKTQVKNTEKIDTSFKPEENIESSSISSSGESIPDRDSDSDYRDAKDKSGSLRLRKPKLKPRILKTTHSVRASRLEHKVTPKVRANKNILKKENKERTPLHKQNVQINDDNVDLETILPSNKISTVDITPKEISKVVVKQTPKPIKKEKKTPAHVTALLSDMTSLFSTPDVIRRVSTDNKTPVRDILPCDKKTASTPKQDATEAKASDISKQIENVEKIKQLVTPKTQLKHKEKAVNPKEKITKSYDLIPQLDEASLAQILQDTSSIPTSTVKSQPTITTANNMSSPGLAGPLSPTLDLLAGLQPEEEGLTEDLLMHVAQLVESSENLQEVIDKQVLGKVDTGSNKTAVQSPFQQASSNLYTQTLSKTVQKNIAPRKDPIEIVRRDGRVITLPPIEAPATRSSKRKIQMETPTTNDLSSPVTSTPVPPAPTTPEPQVLAVSKQYVNKKLSNKKQDTFLPTNIIDKIAAESQESWNSEDDPNRLWCICKQPHNNRFMICCDSCEDWFHGKCVNITKAMGQQMEEQGIEWRCPNCIKKAKGPSKTTNSKIADAQPKKSEIESMVSELTTPPKDSPSKTSCIVCKKPARASSIYCSDSCILKHAQDSLGNQITNKPDSESGKTQEKQKSESRVIVYERKTGRLLAGPNAPTAENLKTWLQKNPTFEVVRPGTLSTIKPNSSKKKLHNEPNKIQTTLNFERIPRKTEHTPTPAKPSPGETKEKPIKLHLPVQKQEPPKTSSPKTPPPKTPPSKTPPPKPVVTPKPQQIQIIETPKANPSQVKAVSEPRKPARNTVKRTQSVTEAPPATPSTSRRKDSSENRTRMNTEESIRDNVRKSLQEQMSIRMAEYDGPKFSEDDIQQFAFETEDELHDLFRDVGMKYKAKYRSLMFNIKDRKNLTLWEKICDKSITPKQLVRLSPEELASQELAQWRDKEAKYQLELIKKSELDLLAANKTYVLKTHKGEEVMETKESVSTELDPNVPVEDVVSVLNDAINDEPPQEKASSPDTTTYKLNIDKKSSNSRKRERDRSSSSSKKSRRDSKKDSNRKSRSSRRRKSESHERESRESRRRSTRKSDKKSTRSRSSSRDKSKIEAKDKSDLSERSKQRSRSKSRDKRRSKSRAHSRSNSKGRDRSRSRGRSKRRSHSRDSSKRRHSSRSKRTNSSDDKFKQRSRSQDNVYNKAKNDSTDSESLERPKSAMLKEQHPAYDPHEPMITSAFSEEDLRKSREDMYDEPYKNEISDYDPAKTYSIDTDLVMPNITYSKLQEKLSEAESDQEPTSTVETSAATIWNGCINMVDVARFYVAAHEVSGSAVDLEEDLSTELDIVGRINPDTVWDYIGKMKKANNKDIVILRLQAANDEEKMQYIALYSYLSSRNRLGVVKVSSTTTVKDFYIVPLPANTTLPPVLLPLDGPGIGEVKTHLLIAIVVRQRKKRLAPHIPKDIIPAKVSRDQGRSFTPPVKTSYTPPASPRRRPALLLPTYMSPALSTTVKDKIAASLASADDEAYSPGSSSSSGSLSHAPPGSNSNSLRTKMEELNRQIEEQKQQIRKMAQANSSAAEDEAYSPSRPMTPPGSVPLSDIALPSNLQEILATIKQRSENTVADVDMRTLPPLP